MRRTVFYCLVCQESATRRNKREGIWVMIDLRSDTVTKPSPAMREAMARAEVGDDVYGEDPTVRELESRVAAITGKQAAVFTCSATQSNLMALMSHCQRGHEYIVGQVAHTYLYEGGGGAVLGSIQPCPLPFNARGELELDEIEAVIKPDDQHFAITRLLCLENTQAGKVLSADYLAGASELAQRHGLRRHLDGARVFNAAVAQEVEIAEICQHFDTVSICLSKGLGAPMGSVLVGDTALIAAARRWRKMLGGGLRQSGIVAAAGLHALEQHVDELALDHARCARLGQALRGMATLPLAEVTATNMLFLSEMVNIEDLTTHLSRAGILISGRRWVLHRDIDDAAIEDIIAACRAFRA